VGVDLQRPLGPLGHRRDAGAHRRAHARDDIGADAGDAFDDDVDAATRFCHLPHDADRANTVQIFRRRVVGIRALENQQYETVGAQGPVDRLDRDGTINGQRLQRQRKSDGASKGKDRKLGRKRRRRRRFGHFGDCGRVGTRRAGRIVPQSKPSALFSFGFRRRVAHLLVPALSNRGLKMENRQMDERQFFTEKPEQRPARLQCPRCRRTNDYSIRWLRRTRKAHIPNGADARDRAMFEKVKDHLVRVDDDVTCKTCGKRFEIPSHRALMFLEELEGLPQEDYDE
jgi:hypothetical protein